MSEWLELEGAELEKGKAYYFCHIDDEKLRVIPENYGKMPPRYYTDVYTHYQPVNWPQHPKKQDNDS